MSSSSICRVHALVLVAIAEVPNVIAQRIVIKLLPDEHVKATDTLRRLSAKVFKWHKCKI